MIGDYPDPGRFGADGASGRPGVAPRSRPLTPMGCHGSTLHVRSEIEPARIRSPRLAASTLIFDLCGAWLVALGAYFMFIRPPLLPEDFRYIGMSPAAIRSAIPLLEPWAQRIFTVLGGFMAGAGVLTIFVATHASTGRQTPTRVVLALAGLFTVGTMSVVNLRLDSAFKWLLLIPSLLWAFGLVLPAVLGRRQQASAVEE